MGHNPYAPQTNSLTGAPQALVGAASAAAQVPDGTAAEVVEWIEGAVSGQQALERAAAALAEEQARSKPRKTVVAAASAVIDA